MQFDWWTFAIQIVNFLILVWLLHRFLYRPVRNIIEQRRLTAEAVVRAADKEKQEAEATRRAYEAQLAEAGQQRSQLIEEAHAKIVKERKAVMEEAATDAQRLVADAKKNIEKERQAALDGLQAEIGTVAAEMARTILRRSGVSQDPSAFAETMAVKFAELPERDRKHLLDAVSKEGSELQIITAGKLNKSGRETWRKKLAGLLGTEALISFHTDPDLLGGAQLRYRDNLLDCSWRGDLQELADIPNNANISKDNDNAS